MTAEGAFSKIEDRGGGLVRVWTGPLFDDLPFETKQSFLGVVYDYFFDGQSDREFIAVHVGRTGKQIGTVYRWGLKMN